MDPQKTQKTIDILFESIQVTVQDEIASLLGVDFVLTDSENTIVSKAEAFNAFAGKQICTKIDLTGEVEGGGALFLGVKDAIQLAGTLIMLPSSELDEIVGREDYSDEIEDSYGEIANVICSALTTGFGQKYPKPCRFIKKEQGKIAPLKVEIDSDEPVKNETFYQASFSMAMSGNPMGDMVILLPAAAFDLESEAASSSDVETAAPVDEPEVKPPEVKEEIQGKEEVQESLPESPVVQPATSPGFNVEKHKKRVDQVLVACQEKMSGVMGSLLGVDVVLAGLKTTLVSKEDFFLEHASGKQVIADMDVVGDLKNRSFFSIGIKDAINLGGLLIMLPPSELENVINEEDFGEDAKDAYGEIANIVSGVYTSIFEEQYTKKLRFVMKSIQQVVPSNVEFESSEPIPNVAFYLSTMNLKAGGKEFGSVHMLFPADLLQLESLIIDEADEVSSGGITAGKKNEPPFDRVRHKKRVDDILADCQKKMSDDVSELLGCDFRLVAAGNKIISKDRFFSETVSSRQIVAKIDVEGEIKDTSFLSISIKDAIRIGGNLIMIPDSELEVSVDEENFNLDMEDAYGEIVNIISGLFTASFEADYTKKIRFVKTGLQQVDPADTGLSDDETMPEQNYYVSSMNLVLEENSLGAIHILFPASMLQLDGLVETVEGMADIQDQEEVKSNGLASGVADDLNRSADILLIGDDETEVSKLRTVFENRGYVVRVLSFKDNVNSFISRDLKAVYLVSRDVDEQALGLAIKVSSVCSLPLIAAAPGWTKSKVIKAVKYGVRDILLTPATTEDIEENIANNLVRMAA